MIRCEKHALVIDKALDAHCFICVFAFIVCCFASVFVSQSMWGVFSLYCLHHRLFRADSFTDVLGTIWTWNWQDIYFFPQSGKYCSVDWVVCLLHSGDTWTMELKVASEPTDQTIATLRVKAEGCLGISDRSELPQFRQTFPIWKRNTVWNRARPTGSRIITRLPAEYLRAWVFFFPLTKEEGLCFCS